MSEGMNKNTSLSRFYLRLEWEVGTGEYNVIQIYIYIYIYWLFFMICILCVLCILYI